MENDSNSHLQPSPKATGGKHLPPLKGRKNKDEGDLDDNKMLREIEEMEKRMKQNKKTTKK